MYKSPILNVLSSLFLVKFTLKGGKLEGKKKRLALTTGIIASVYAFWLVYAAGLKYIMLSSILYAIGYFAFRVAWKEKHTDAPLFKTYEKFIAIAIAIVALISLVMILSGIPVVNEAARWIVHEFKYVAWLN